MAEDDIYNNKKRYENFVKRLENMVIPPAQRKGKGIYKCKYWCKNKANLEYFRKLFDIFEFDDLSYIRRMRVIRVMQLICYLTDKDLKKLERPDMNKMVVYVRNHFAVKTQQGFILDVRYIWRRILPEKDERGRYDETIVPYVVRHLSGKIDRSKQKIRQDKLTPEEFDKLLAYFSDDLRMQAYLSLALESLGRPQEILFRRLKDVEIHDNYAKIWISDHGKEGVGFLQCIDSFPYVMRWFNAHPFKRDKDAFLFINTGTKKRGQQMTPFSINKKLRKACKDLKIDKRITSYSIKRNGVTFARLRGDSDVQIQKRARWTTTKQLQTYDLSRQDDAMKVELIRRGLIQSKEEKYKDLQKVKTCHYCSSVHGMSDDICTTCKRPLDRNEVIEKESAKERELQTLRDNMTDMQKKFEILVGQIKENAAQVIEEKLHMST